MAAAGALVVYRSVFTALGCLMLGALVYTCITDGSLFRTELLTPSPMFLFVLQVSEQHEEEELKNDHQEAPT
ncbi:hypothetical protein D1007_43698 [Hordeum vulgare]|nr:hypothetical protein D1007_43698 [Hordeum vulgare]KAI4994585.1 hypothetical protein ZWY2020_034226 [Hordeum vulgare]